MASVAVFTVTRNGLPDIKRVFRAIRQSEVDLKHYVVDSASTDGTAEWLQEQYEAGKLEWLYLSKKDLGQSICSNIALDVAMDERPDWVVQWNQNAVPRSKRLLKKMLRVSEGAAKETVLVLSPAFGDEEKLVGEATVAGHVVKGIGKIDLRLAVFPGHMFGGWRFNKFNPLSFGTSEEIADVVTQMQLKGRAATLGIATTLHADEITQEIEEARRYVSFGL